MEVATMTGRRRRACEEHLHAEEGQRENVAPLRALADWSIADGYRNIRRLDGRGVGGPGVVG